MEEHPTYFLLTDSEPDLHEIHRQLARPDVGSVVWFTGTVRGSTARDGLPPETLQLEYTAYEAMAEERMRQIAQEIWQRWPLVKGIAIVQRLGVLPVGALTTLVACASGHRDEGGFEAARYGIDRLKEIVPVWKKERSAGGAIWIEGSYRPTSADNQSA